MTNPKVKAVVAALCKAKNLDPTKQAHPITILELKELIRDLRKAKEIEVSIVVLICYMTAERLGSVLLLQTKAINITMKRWV